MFLRRVFGYDETRRYFCAAKRLSVCFLFIYLSVIVAKKRSDTLSEKLISKFVYDEICQEWIFFHVYTAAKDLFVCGQMSHEAL